MMMVMIILSASLKVEANSDNMKGQYNVSSSSSLSSLTTNCMIARVIVQSNRIGELIDVKGTYRGR